MAYFHSPQIVKDGLVLALDAANTKSYPGSGTTWFDKSGNNRNGTLVNGPTFSNANLGSISFDAVNDHINFSSNILNLTNGSHTFEMWARARNWINDSSNCGDKRTYPFTIHSNFDNFVGFVTNNTNRFQFQRRDPGVSYFLSPPSAQELNVWYHLVGVLDNPGSKMFVNGALVASSTTAIATANPTTFRLGWNDFNCSNSYFDGDIGQFKIYNRALSTAEVLQNYNATKGRFGL
jgi:hypothetical protein